MSEAKRYLPSPARVLRKARRAQGWSRRELSVQSGVAESTLRRWENGDHTPREGQALRAVCHVLRITPGAVLDGDDEENAT